MGLWACNSGARQHSPVALWCQPPDRLSGLSVSSSNLAEAPQAPRAAFGGEKGLCAYIERRNRALGTLFAIEVAEVNRRGNPQKEAGMRQWTKALAITLIGVTLPITGFSQEKGAQPEGSSLRVVRGVVTAGVVNREPVGDGSVFP